MGKDAGKKKQLREQLRERLQQSAKAPAPAPKKKGGKAAEPKAAAPAAAAEKPAALTKTQGKKAGKKAAAPAAAAPAKTAAAVKGAVTAESAKKKNNKKKNKKVVVKAPVKGGHEDDAPAAENMDLDVDVSDVSDVAPSDLDVSGSDDDDTPIETPAAAPKLSKMQEGMMRQLESAHFRFLNEQLYTTDGATALRMMKEEPHLFDLYHRGFRHQAESWPENPVQRILAEIKAHVPTTATVVDMGCGDALLAQELKPLGYTVRSFDLVAKPPHVEAADMASVPVKEGLADVVVFSLSLMNTDWGKGAAEGCRVLRKGGIMKIAEVVSRIPNLDDFIRCLEKLGLNVVSKDTKNPMFVMLTLRKKAAAVDKRIAAEFEPLKPCIYKKR
ncbi:25S rRNA (adenine645-N1)-methyltransferase [Blastocladiella emersonii ATCC 22665]|nr:25S rRNA (adenine645-N1)-methyltransferase [Blastocladiella emersonii ATCC 22665]